MSEKVKSNNKPSYAQASASKVSNILKIKENFPNLSVKNIYNTINDLDKVKFRINMTTKDLSHKQLIIPMSNKNKSKFMALSSKHITNLNSSLKNIKLDVMIDFICTD